MDHRRDGCFAIMLAALMLPLCGCSREMPTASTGHDATVVDPPKPADPGRAVTFFVPRASGTVRIFPELGIFEIAPTSTDMQSSYFRTTAANREFDRPTSAFATFETDANLPTQTFEFDASGLVAQSRGARLGFRMKLEADPAYEGMGFLGTAFARYSTPSGLRIEVTTTRAEANDRLQNLISGMALGPGLQAGLLAPLQRAGVVLGDTNPDNDGAACRQFRIFLGQVATMELNLQLSSVQAFDLKELAQNIMTSLGCPDLSVAAGSLGGPTEVAAR